MNSRSALISGGAALVLAGLTSGLACSFSAPAHRGPLTFNFDGERFHNHAPFPDKSVVDFLLLDRSRAHWEEVAGARPGPPPPRRVGGGALRVTFINHSTTLVQMDGLNILTDPIYSERASPLSWVGPRRARPPGVRFDDLPPIDAVLVSHNHYDHLDVPTLRRLAERDAPRILVGLGNEQLLADEGVPGAVPVNWGDSVTLGGAVSATSVPVQHWSGRGLSDRFQTLWTGYVIEGPSGPVYFAGDTGWGPHFGQVRERFGPPRLSLLPIGAYLPREFMRSSHISPCEAVDAHVALGSATSVAIHFGTFELGDDGPTEGVAALRAYLALVDPAPPPFWVLDFGEGRDVPPLPDGPPPQAAVPAAVASCAARMCDTAPPRDDDARPAAAEWRPCSGKALAAEEPAE